MPGVTESMRRLRFEGSLYPKDFKESQREYDGVVIPLFQTSDPENQYIRIKYSLDDITLHDGTQIQGVVDQGTLMEYLENDDIYLFEADSERAADGTYMLTNIAIPRKI
jgi:hypothetical protein